MICYNDKCYCPFWRECAAHSTCFRILSKDVEERAANLGLPIDMFMEKPECFKKQNKKPRKRG